MRSVDPYSNPAIAGHDMGFGDIASKKLIQGNDVYEESIAHPPHYNSGEIEAIEVIEDWGLGFNDGNALKYIARHRHKGDSVQDIEKAIWYLQRHLNIMKKMEGK